MNKITFPLKARMTGAAVADLQDALQLLLDRAAILTNEEAARRELSAALQTERAAQSHGDATVKLIGIFQEARHLQVSGAVDEPTAGALNAILDEWGLLDRAVAPKSHVVSGRVRRQDDLPVHQMKVRAIHEAELGAIRLGDDSTDAEGRYTIRYELLPGVDGINLGVSAIGEDGELLQSSEVIHTAKPLEIIDLTLPMARKPATQRRIEGQIMLQHGLPAEHLKLRLYRRDFGGKATLLNETSTLAGGHYAFTFDPGGKVVSLEVRAVKGVDEEIPLSKPLYDISGEARALLNLVAPGDLQPLASEYQRLSADLMPHVGQMMKLAEARENSERQDITVLNRATGWDARLIALAASAAKLSVETGMSPEVLYALARVGLPTDKQQLANVSTEVLEQALQKAQEAGIVKLDGDQVAHAKSVFQPFSQATRLNEKASGALSSIGELLSKAGANAQEKLTDKEQQTFASLYFSHRGEAAELWQKAEEQGIPREKISGLRLQGKLAYLTLNNATLTESLQQEIGSSDNLAQLVEKDLHHSATWAARLNEMANGDERKLDNLIPSAYEGKTVADRLESYAADLARKVRVSFPTRIVGRMVEKGELRLDEQNNELKLSVVAFLKNAEGLGFEMGRMPVGTFVRENDVQVDEATIQGVKLLQRLYQISPSDEALKVVSENGFKSGQDIVAFPFDEFLERYGDKFPTREEAQLVHRKAQQVSAVTQNLVLMAKQMEIAPPMYALSAPASQREIAKSNLIKHYPTMKSLFGSLDFCECEHCRSVLSPAAYLVDLFQFLDRDKKVWNSSKETPFEALTERRPDLQNLPLTCENTNTLLPYIDVVNEILEYYVANGKLDEKAARDIGEATTPELLAEPQNIISKAYDTLKDARYPLALPFDLWLETVRHFCDHFETPLWRVLEVFRPADELFPPLASAKPYYRAAVFAEYLGISPSEYAIFTEPDPLPKWFLLYGYDAEPKALTETTDPTNDQRTDLNSAKSLARRLGINYKDLIDLVGTSFVNPKLGTLIVLSKLGVTISDILFYKKNKGLLDFQQFILHTGTALHETDATFEFVLAENRDLFAIKKSNTGSASTEVHVLSAVSKYQQFVLHTGTALHETDATFEFVLAENRDLFAVKKSNTGSASTEVHVLSAVSNYQQFILHTGTALHETDATFEFVLAANRDLFAVKKSNTGSASTEVHVLSAQDVSALSTDDRQRRNEAIAFVQRLDDLSQTFQASGFNARTWLNDALDKNAFDDILVLADPDAGCNFDKTILRYANIVPADNLVFLRINLFVRLWKMLGWTIEETDRALQVFLPKSSLPLTAANLGAALKTALVYLAHLKALDERVKIGKNARLKLLAFWSNLSTTGRNPLYAQLFLTPSVLKNDAVFDDALGNYLSKPGIQIKDHVLALQGALGLTADDVGRILTDASKDLATAELSLGTVSLLYRYGLMAEALKLSIRDFISVKQLSGLDPFKLLDIPPVSTLEKEHPWGQTLRFIEIADEIKESGLKIEDLDYLLRHRFDETGKYRPNNDATLVLLKTLSEAIRVIRSDHAVPANSVEMSEDALRQKLGLALPSEVVERFLAMLNGTVEFTATKTGVQSGDKLDPEAFKDELAIREVSYNATRQEQKLTFRGVLSVLFRTEKDRLKALFPWPDFSDLLDDLEKQARLFFDNYLQKQKLRLEGEAGFLNGSDFKTLFEPLKPLLKIAPGDTQQQIDDKLKANETIERENQTTLEGRRDHSAQVFLPFLQQRLIRQFLVQTMTAQTGADPALVESLLTDARLLGDIQAAGAPQPLLKAFTATGERGLTVTFFDGSGVELGTSVFADADTGLKDRERKLLKPPGADSARFEGYLDVPSTGTYRFYVALDKRNAEAELRFPDFTNPLVFTGKAAQDKVELGNGVKEFVELKSGIPYRFRLDLRQMNGGEARLLVQGENMPKESVSQLTLYPLTAIRGAERAVLSLTKALQLVQGLGLNEREIRYLLTHAVAFDDLSLRELPTRSSDDSPARAKVLFGQFLRVAAYARLKRDLAGDTNDLIDIFESNGSSDLDNVYRCIAKLTRRDEATVKAGAKALFAVPAFASEKPLQRLWEALQAVERFGVPVASLMEWTRIVSSAPTPEQRFKIARDLKEAIKARFEPETWQRIARPIFDKLRRRQRDTLVAYIMDQKNFELIEHLFEYFLVDPGMEPVVQTSRLRLAVSSVQLFIQRCLLNLEPKVHPSAINPEHWRWMKRYRVWEANRKIFLFPENWLEPEFRDDKTHLYQELESALLQGDISNDLAEDAFFQYLKQLEELARLDIVTMYCEEKSDPALNILHVIGRTYNLPHKYFYRRYANHIWTPWEPVTAQIQGDHVVAVVWRQRLHLFWVTFLEQAKQGIPGVPLQRPKKAKKLDMEVKLLLNWSEYLQGQWTMVKSSDVANSIPTDVNNDFNRREARIYVDKQYNPDGTEGALYINLKGVWVVFLQEGSLIQRPRAFRVESKNSPPELLYGGFRQYPPYLTTYPQVPHPTRDMGSSGLRTWDGNSRIAKSILGSLNDFSLLLGTNPLQSDSPKSGSPTSPFFYLDNQHTFFVEPSLVEVPLDLREEFGIVDDNVVWAEVDFNRIPITAEIPVLKQLVPNTLSANFEMQSKADWLTDGATVLQFDKQLVGKDGGLDFAVLPAGDVSRLDNVNSDPRLNVIGAGV